MWSLLEGANNLSVFGITLASPEQTPPHHGSQHGSSHRLDSCPDIRPMISYKCFRVQAESLGSSWWHSGIHANQPQFTPGPSPDRKWWNKSAQCYSDEAKKQRPQHPNHSPIKSCWHSTKSELHRRLFLCTKECARWQFCHYLISADLAFRAGPLPDGWRLHPSKIWTFCGISASPSPILLSYI